MTHAVCVSCTSSPQAEAIKCESLDCPWLYARHKAEEELGILEGVPQLSGAIEQLADHDAGWEVESDDGSEDTGFRSSESNVFL